MGSTLEARWVTRRDGDGQNHIHYLDLVVDGQPLRTRMHDGNGAAADNITGLGSTAPDASDEVIDRFLGLRAPDAPSGRTSIYVCALCSDLGCGAITVLIERAPGVVIWRDFGWQNDYEPDVTSDGMVDVGPFQFDESAYRAFFESLRNPPARG